MVDVHVGEMTVLNLAMKFSVGMCMLLFYISTILFGSVCGAVAVSHFIVKVFQ